LCVLIRCFIFKQCRFITCTKSLGGWLVEHNGPIR